MMTERDRAVVRLANSLSGRYGLLLPLPIERVCRRCGVRLLPLSELERCGMASEAVFACWGNRDGVALLSRDGAAIAYNDRAAENRLRFTLAEELMHLLLGHAADARFAVGEQSYEEETYARYEAEAKHGAAMLLLPPTVYFRCRERCSLDAIARLCRISTACAWTAAQYYEQHEAELKSLFTAQPLRRSSAPLPSKHPVRPRRVSF